MIVKELIEQLQRLDSDLEVVISKDAKENYNESGYSF